VLGPPGVPVYCGVEEIFAIAHRFVLTDLKAKAIKFFSETCSVENIVERVFSNFGLIYSEIAEVCGLFFLSNWNSIRERQELDSYFEDLENDNSPRLAKVSKRFRELMKGVQQPSLPLNGRGLRCKLRWHLPYVHILKPAGLTLQYNFFFE
jgi:hypothetical protein